MPQARTGEHRGSQQLRWSQPQTAQVNRVPIVVHDPARRRCQIHSDPAISREIAELDAVVALRVGHAPLVTQSQAQRQPGPHPPVILCVEGGLLGFLEHRRLNVDVAVGRPSQFQRRHRVSILAQRVKNGIGRSGAPGKMKQPSRVVGLKEIVEEQPLLPAKLQHVVPLDPIQR